MFFTVGLYAQHTTTGANSDWNNSAAWDQGSVPTASDNVIINHSLTVTVSTAVCNNLTVNYNGGSGSLTMFGLEGMIPDSWMIENGGFYEHNGLMLLSPIALFLVAGVIWVQRAKNRKLIEEN